MLHSLQNLLCQAERMISMVLNTNCITIGKIYILKRNDKFYRVRTIKNLMIEGRRFCDCFFIDVGRIETVASDDLFNCVGEFLNISPQAICFKLFGFDELNRCPHIERNFSAWILDKQLIGCLMMGKEQYQIQLAHGIKMPKVSITPFVFYPKFAMYKPILLKQIGESLPKPTMSCTEIDRTINARVSHVSPCGLVYFHLDDKSISYIAALIQHFVSENQQFARRILSSEMINSMTLIFDIKRKMYHRAKILSVQSASTKCFCIDTGEICFVDATNIIPLHKNSMLTYYPGQAVPALLHSFPSFDNAITERLKEILTNNTEVQVKVNDQKNKLPVVTIFKQLVNINELIRMERELYK